MFLTRGRPSIPPRFANSDIWNMVCTISSRSQILLTGGIRKTLKQNIVENEENYISRIFIRELRRGSRFCTFFLFGHRKRNVIPPKSLVDTLGNQNGGKHKNDNRSKIYHQSLKNAILIVKIRKVFLQPCQGFSKLYASTGQVVGA